jgi:hypothetical protein
MEKLLITLTHSDGYTYSSEQTLPVVFSSKEEFIITLEDMVQKYIKDSEEFQVVYQKYQKKHDAAREAYSYVIDKRNRSKPNEKTSALAAEATAKFLQSTQEYNDFFTSNKPKDEFQLGGQTFNFENFTYRAEEDRSKIHMDIPRICTIDEFFSDVDFNLKTSKFKP